MKYFISKNIFVWPVLCLILGGCRDDVLYEEEDFRSSSENVSFSAIVSPVENQVTRGGDITYEPLLLNNGGDEFPLYLHTWEHPMDEMTTEVLEQTRGVEVTSARQLSEVHGAFGVSGEKEADGSRFISMQKTKLIDNGDYNIWTTESKNRWPGNERISFNAVAPYDHLSKLTNAVYGKNSISFTYQAEKGNGTNDAEKQADLMTAVATMNREESADYNYRVPLRFGHALSAVKFAVRDVLKGKVISISIKGVKGKGDCVFTADDDSRNGKFEWSNQSGNETYTQVFNHPIENGNYDPTDESQDVILNTLMPEKTFMLIPQEIPDEATIEVEIERENVSPLPARIKVSGKIKANDCRLYTSPRPRDRTRSRMPASA